MTISNSFLVRIVADTELGRTAAATAAGSYSAAMSVPSLATPIARLDPFNPDGTDYPDCSGGTTTNGYSMTRAWIWASKAMFDTTTRRVLFVNSPHPFDAFGQPTFPNGNYNGYITLLTSYDEADNDIHVYESPFSYNNATWPRTVGHAFDNQCLVDRTLYKMTLPLFVTGSGWVQPQIAKIDIDQVTDAVSSAREGEAYTGSINAPWEWDESALTWRNPGRNLTAGALDYLPGSDSLVFFHKKWLSFCPISTGTWTQPIDLEAQGYGFSGTYVAELGRTTWPIHNIGHYNAASGKFVCGGGAYNPDGASNHRYQLDWISVDATTQAITKLDDSPVIMSVSETDMPTTEPAHLREAKVAACAGPNSVESLFFHDNGNVYGLNPFRPPGSQWRLITTLAFEVDLCVPIDDYGVVLLFTSGANGTASMRVYKPPVAGDHTPPSIPLDVTATATSSSEITVTWSASTDPVIQGDTTSGVAGYRVYRNGTLVTPGPVGLVTSFNDTGLTANTQYSYTISAYDAAGNESVQSASAQATTQASVVSVVYRIPFSGTNTRAYGAFDNANVQQGTMGVFVGSSDQLDGPNNGTNQCQRTGFATGGYLNRGYMRFQWWNLPDQALVNGHTLSCSRFSGYGTESQPKFVRFRVRWVQEPGPSCEGKFAFDSAGGGSSGDRMLIQHGNGSTGIGTTFPGVGASNQAMMSFAQNISDNGTYILCDVGVWYSVQLEYMRGLAAACYFKVWQNSNTYASPTRQFGPGQFSSNWTQGAHYTGDAQMWWGPAQGHRQSTHGFTFDIQEVEFGLQFDPNWHAG